VHIAGIAPREDAASTYTRAPVLVICTDIDEANAIAAYLHLARACARAGAADFHSRNNHHRGNCRRNVMAR